MNTDIKNAALLMAAYVIAISLCCFAGNSELAFGLMCSWLTLFAVAVFTDDENRKLKRRLNKYKRAHREAVAKWLESENDG